MFCCEEREREREKEESERELTTVPQHSTFPRKEERKGTFRRPFSQIRLGGERKKVVMGATDGQTKKRQRKGL